MAKTSGRRIKTRTGPARIQSSERPSAGKARQPVYPIWQAHRTNARPSQNQTDENATGQTGSKPFRLSGTTKPQSPKPRNRCDSDIGPTRRPVNQPVDGFHFVAQDRELAHRSARDRPSDKAPCAPVSACVFDRIRTGPASALRLTPHQGRHRFPTRGRSAAASCPRRGRTKGARPARL